MNVIAPPSETPDGERALRACLRDLVALSTMPAWWIGSSLSEISDSVGDMLASMLRADAVYVQLRDADSGEILVDVVGVTRIELEAALKGLGGRGSMRVSLSTCPERPVHLVRMPIGLDGELGSAVVGSRRADFPNELESLLLRVAVNQVCVAVEHATLLTRQRKSEQLAHQRAEQQAAGVRFGVEALRSVSLDRLFDRALGVVTDALHVTGAGVFELSEDARSLLLRAGVGWRVTCIGRARVGTNADSHLGYTLRAADPVVVRELRRDRRFAGARLFLRHGIESCISVVIGNQDGPFGVLVASMRTKRAFTRDDAQFLQSIANLLAVAVQRHRAETAREESLVRASAAQAEAERASRSKSEFLAMMSHDIRTPLNAIAGYTELMELELHGPLTDAQRRDLAAVRRSQQYLLSLVDNVLTFMKLESGRVTYRMGELPVAELLFAIDELIRPQMEIKQLQYTQHCACTGALVCADREKIQQIVLNLLSNAAKFTQREGVVRLECSADQNSVRFDVSDTGCGIPANKLEHAFEPYVQVDRTFSRPADGTGLGLAISRLLARGMKGDISAQSAVGKGSKFTLTLPRALEQPAQESSPMVV